MRSDSTSTPSNNQDEVASSTMPLVVTTDPSRESSSSTTAPDRDLPITIAFGGDVHFEGFLGDRFAAEGAAIFDPMKPLFSGADIAIVNFESAITKKGTPVPKAYNFRAPFQALGALGTAGVDVVSLANNHAIDFGTVGLNDTLNAQRRSKVAVIGIGSTEREAYRAHKIVVRGHNVAIIAASHVIDGPLVNDWTARGRHPGIASAYEIERLLKSVRTARASSDTVVVYLHWGTEGLECPQTRQKTLAAELVEAGADIIVGTHAHRLQGAGRLGDAFVAYGLGNFIWYSHGGIGAVTGVLTVEVRGTEISDYSFAPAIITEGIPTPLSGNGDTTALERWESLRDCTDLEP